MAMPARTDPQALVLEAVAFAAEKHRHQRRKDAHASPYINHPIELAILLEREGISNPVILCAALLHDTIEDTQTTEDELHARFGERIARVVMEVTDDKGLPKQERKRLQVETAASKSHRAKLLKIADKTSNLRSLMMSPPTGWTDERLSDYVEWAAEVVRSCRGLNAALDAAFDAAYAEASARFGV